MPDEKFGTDNLKQAIGFACGITKKMAVDLKDGKFTWFEGFGFIGELLEAPAVIKSFPAIKQEVHDLSAEERADLHAYIVDEFSIPNEQVEALIEDSISFTLAAAGLVERFKALKK